MTAYDVVVIGAGPAGLSAAIEASKHDLGVLLIDEQKSPGGQIYRNLSANLEPTPNETDILGQDYWRGRELLDELKNCDATYISGATVWTVENSDSNLVVGYIKDNKSFLRSTKHIILATGAYERPVPIPGWTLPGVMTAGAAQIMMKESASIPNRPTLIAGSGPLLQLVTTQLLQAGANIAGYIETTKPSDYLSAARYLPSAFKAHKMLVKGLKMRRRIVKSDIPRFAGATNLKCIGNDEFEGIRFEVRSKKHEIGAECLLLHEGIVPNVQLTRLLGLKHVWVSEQRYWKPDLGKWGNSSNKLINVAGDGGGIDGALVAEASGRIAALDVANRLGAISDIQKYQMSDPLFASKRSQMGIRRFLDQLYRPPREIVCPNNPKIVVCRCEDVTVQEILSSIDTGCTGPNQLKAYSRCGMGPCQGRICGLPVSEILANKRQIPIDEIGYYNVRSPIKPIPMSSFTEIDADPFCSKTI